MVNFKNSQLKELVYVKKSIIPKNDCKLIIDKISNNPWQTHSWTRYNEDNIMETHSYSTKEPTVSSILNNPELESILNPIVLRTLRSYNEYLGYDNSQVNYFSSIRFNQYNINQTMRKHIDHINSLFDGNLKGIPVLSFILNFNDDYKGGDLIFWEDYKISLGEGDVVVFPSLFLFPHRVTEVEENIRYSGVCWAW